MPATILRVNFTPMASEFVFKALFQLRSGPRWRCGAAPASRSFTSFEPFAYGFQATGSRLSFRNLATCGSSLSLLGILRFAASLSVTDFSNLGASVSLRSFYGLGTSLAVFDDSCPGSSVALRSFARLGSSLPVCGLAWFGSAFSLSVLDCSCRVVGSMTIEVCAPTFCGLWTSSTLRETIWCLLGLGSRSPRICAVAAALPLWSWASMGCPSIG